MSKRVGIIIYPPSPRLSTYFRDKLETKRERLNIENTWL